MAVYIPLRNDLQDYTQQVELDGQTYGLRLIWNVRSLHWALSLFDALDVAIVHNLSVVEGFPLGRRVQDSRMPPGFLFAIDTAGAHADPSFADLGLRTQLVYFSHAEL